MRTLTSALAVSILASSVLAISCGGDDDDDTTETPSWEGQTYILAIPNSSWYEPEGVGSEVGDFVPRFVIQIEEESSGNLEVLLGTADAAGAQEMCNPTTTTTATAAYPDIQIGPVDFPIYLQHVREDIAVNATVYGLTLTNVLPDGDTAAVAGEITAMLDTRDVYSMFTLLGDSRTPESVCTALASLEASCEACPDGEVYCLTLRGRRLGATLGSPIEPIDAGSVPATCVP